MNDIRKARGLYEKKRDIFKGLTELRAEKVPLWHQSDRQSRVKRPGKEIECVYRQTSQSVSPSLLTWKITLLTIDNK